MTTTTKPRTHKPTQHTVSRSETVSAPDRPGNRTAQEYITGPAQTETPHTVPDKPASRPAQAQIPTASSTPVMRPGQTQENQELSEPLNWEDTMSSDAELPIHKITTGHAYVYGRVSNDTSAKHVKTKMMVDQGNLLTSGVGVSEAFFKKMGLHYEKICRSNVATAGKGLGMTKLGQTKPFTIRLDGINKAFKTKATVIRELSDDINLGGGFLQQAAAKGVTTRLEFLPSGTLLHMNKETVDLVSKVLPEEDGPPIQQEKDPTGETLEPDRPS